MSGGLLLLIIFAPIVLGTEQSLKGGAEDGIIQTNKVGENTTSKVPVNTTLIEKFAPNFSNPSKLFNMDMRPAGSSVRLRCKTEGNPTPNMTWYKDGEPIARAPTPAYYGKWSIGLDELIKNDSGNYTCVACNKLGCINHTTNLQIQESYPSKPFIKEQLRNITANLNETVRFSCDSITDLEPYIQWTWISPNITEEREIQSDDPNDKPETLTIYNVTADSEGWYKCTAINTLGQDSSQGYLQVVDNKFEKEAQLISKNRLTIIMVTLIATVLISISIAIVAIKKFHQERIEKKRARETAQHLMEEQWTKIIRVKHILEDAMMIPDVTIERVRHTDLSHETSNVPISLSNEYFLPVDIKWELPKDSLSLGEVLGQGEFGKVFKANYTDIARGKISQTVAVKTLKDIHSDADMIALTSEMEIMKLIGKHENIVNLLGCCSQHGTLWVVIEYARYGCLLDFLHMHKPDLTSDSEEPGEQLTLKDLVEFALQVAKGMEFLASRGCIHRDLAARNVLVSAPRVLKVADFGLARDVRGSNVYHKRTVGKLPLKWMAPESIAHNLYTTQSDVWSFGILVWEIMTFGGVPYQKISVHNVYAHLKSGGRLEKPNDCSQEIYALMLLCWDFIRENRPQFSNLVTHLEHILSKLETCNLISVA